MQIKRLEVSNFGRVAHFAADLPPLSLVCGGNGRGKSYLLDSIAFALTGDPGRSGNKKNLPLLLHRGAQTGKVRVVDGDGQIFERDIVTGRFVGQDPTVPPALPLVLRAQQFASLTSLERRAFLFGLTGVSLGPEEIVKRLHDWQIDGDLIGRIAHLLGGGFAPALAEADRRRKESVGAWHEVTGENYGPKKAPTWKVEAPTFNEVELHELRNDLGGWNAEVGRLNQLIGELRAQERARSQIPNLRAQAATHASHTSHLNDLRANHKKAAEELEATPEPRASPRQAALAGVEQSPERQAAPSRLIWECPKCKVSLTAKDGRLVEVPPQAPPAPKRKPAPAPEAQPQLAGEDPNKGARERRAELQRIIGDLDAQIDGSQRRVAEADAAARLLKDMEDTPIREELAEAPAALAKAQEQVGQHQAAERDLLDAQRRARDAQGKTERAMLLHRTIQKWDALTTALSPDGIPAEILKDALGPLQAELEGAAKATGWPVVTLTPDMEITWDGHPYQMLGRSHRWRVDAMLAVAIAVISDVKLVVLDEFDLLDLPGRGQALSWLYWLADEGFLDSVIIMATLKAQPVLSDMPKAKAFWLGEMQEAGAMA